MSRIPIKRDKDLALRRGQVVIVAAAGDYGKPRPAVIIQSDVFPRTHPSVIVCQMTSTIEDAQDYRIAIEPSTENGLRQTTHIMVDKPVTVKRDRIRDVIGHLRPDEMKHLDESLAFVFGLGD